MTENLRKQYSHYRTGVKPLFSTEVRNSHAATMRGYAISLQKRGRFRPFNLRSRLVFRLNRSARNHRITLARVLIVLHPPNYSRITTFSPCSAPRRPLCLASFCRFAFLRHGSERRIYVASIVRL